MSEQRIQPIRADQLGPICRGYVGRVPVSLAIRETMRMVALSKLLPLGSSVLDVGCGDGSFWHLYPDRERLTVDGIDLSIHEAQLADQLGVYRRLIVGDISKDDVAGPYDVVLGNCSLEHVSDIHSALRTIRGALAGDGQLIMCVPAFGWARSLPLIRRLEAFSTRLGMAAAGGVDGFFQHHHLYDATTWRLVVEACGFRVVETRALGGPLLNRLFAHHLPVAMTEFLYKAVFKRYPRPTRWTRPSLPPAALEELSAQPVGLDTGSTVEFILRAVPAP